MRMCPPHPLNLISYRLEVAVVTEFKKNTLIPETCSPEGKPECKAGHELIWDGFDKETRTSWLNNQNMACPLQAT
jgi:hypothetical protein